ncbi:ribonuclease [Pigmentiphaga aceris]|uniref:Ribonuclease n=2 Tax=Pigmentiphaga aceris TaxID=1940612 RepID=A0A5C0B5F0_9BURK|nr:ribonuclease [Pigmentiphaga aceris]
MLVLAACAVPASARDAAAIKSDIAFSELPREAQQTLALIKQDGPFPYTKDGTVFGNREGRLPSQARGYYREYTVPTPGARNRGARRIVGGQGPGRNVATSGEYWYTADHYSTFRRIRE